MPTQEAAEPQRAWPPHAASLGHGSNQKHPQQDERSRAPGPESSRSHAARFVVPAHFHGWSHPAAPRRTLLARGGSATRPLHAGTTTSHCACSHLISTQCRFPEVKSFIDTVPSFEPHYIYFFLLFFSPPFFFFFLQKKIIIIVVVPSCTHPATSFGVKLSSLTWPPSTTCSSSLVGGLQGKRSTDGTRRAGRRGAGGALRAGGSCHPGFPEPSTLFLRLQTRGCSQKLYQGWGDANAPAGTVPAGAPQHHRARERRGLVGTSFSRLFQSFFSAKPPSEPPSLNAVIKSFFSSVPCRVISAGEQSHLLRLGTACANEPRSAWDISLGLAQKRAKISETPS